MIAWFARHPVAANLLMALLVVGGVFSALDLRQQVFPDHAPELITISVEYPGAGPEEVEASICTRLENAVDGLDEVRRVRSSAEDGLCVVSVELETGSNRRRLLDEVRARVDTVDSLPPDAEPPRTREMRNREPVLTLAVVGEVDRTTLRRAAEEVRAQLQRLPSVSQVEIDARSPLEVIVEVEADQLHRHGLGLEEVAARVRAASLELAGGSISGEVDTWRLRAAAPASTARQLQRVALVPGEDGARLRLGDVARIREGFGDDEPSLRIDGTPAITLTVYRVGDEKITRLAEEVRAFIGASSGRMDDGLEVVLWHDESRFLASQLRILRGNAISGLVLVGLVLALFLDLRLALWIAAGIPVSFLGALWLLPAVGVSINLLTLFAFIIVLGIVVDDAVVVGENVHRHVRRGRSGAAAAVAGTREVTVPVLFSIATTVAAFVPLLGVSGTAGQITSVIPKVVILTLLFSLVEALLILPSHLTGLRPAAGEPRGPWARLQATCENGMERFTKRVYAPLLRRALGWRTLSLALAVAALMLTVGLIAGGLVRFTFLPPVEAENVAALLTMPAGSTTERTAAALSRLEESARRVAAPGTEAGSAVRHVMTSVGRQPYREKQAQSSTGQASAFTGPHLGEVNLALVPAEGRELGAAELLRRWRQQSDAVPDAVELHFDASLFSAGGAVDVRLESPELEDLRLASAYLQEELRSLPGVFDVSHSLGGERRQLSFTVTPEAESLGLDRGELARQVRRAFYGEEVRRLQRGPQEVVILVRYALDGRRSLAALERLPVRLPGGGEMLFSAAGEVEAGTSPARIERVDGRRTVSVVADVDPSRQDTAAVIRHLEGEVLPRLGERFEGLSYRFGGEQESQRETFGDLVRGFAMALLVIYALLAVVFRSYGLPLVVMAAIPFGLIGAVWGHLLLGLSLNVYSFFGVVALSGVIVNDSLVLVDFVNRRRRAGVPAREAILGAGEARMRPILLTSLTTFVGLLPLVLERSLEANFLIPMAVSIAFGILVGTLITLVLVPVGCSLLLGLGTD